MMAQYGMIRPGRPGTPLSGYDLDRARSTPSPGQYGDPAGMSSEYELAKLGGKFGLQNPPSVFDIPRHIQELPGPGKYSGEKANGLAGGVKFSDANVPTDIERKIREASKTPSTFDYAERSRSDKIVYPRADRNVTRFTMALRPSFVDEAQRAKAYVPSPDAYQTLSRPSTSWASGAKQKMMVRPATVGPKCSTVIGLWRDLVDPPQNRAIEESRPERMESHRPSTTGKTKKNKISEGFQKKSVRRSKTAPKAIRHQSRRMSSSKHDALQFKAKVRLRNSASIKLQQKLSSGPEIKVGRTTIEAISNRSSASIDRRVKLTSPLWKYEIPKQRDRGEKVHQKRIRYNGDRIVREKKNPNRKKSSKFRGRVSGTGNRSSMEETTLENLWRPTKERPFLSLEDTLELAKMNLRALDSAASTKCRKDVLGML